MTRHGAEQLQLTAPSRPFVSVFRIGGVQEWR